ncbi:MAG: hypothetical protein AAFU61_17965, partial [Pseudomonadota bacterium]
WLKIAAEQEEPRALFALALAYRNGDMVAKDLHQSDVWMRRAAAAGMAKAQFSLAGRLFAQSKLRRTRGRSAGAARADSGAATGTTGTTGTAAAAAAGAGGGAAVGGDGASAADEALAWLRKAAAQSHAPAVNSLACCYRYGVCVPKDLKMAAKLFAQAAHSGGSPRAEFHLGYVTPQGGESRQP